MGALNELTLLRDVEVGGIELVFTCRDMSTRRFMGKTRRNITKTRRNKSEISRINSKSSRNNSCDTTPGINGIQGLSA